MNDARSRPPCNIYIVTQGSPGNARPLVGADAPQPARLGYDPLPPTPVCTRLDNGYRRCCITSPYDGTTHCAVLPPDGTDNVTLRGPYAVGAADQAFANGNNNNSINNATRTPSYLFNVRDRDALGARPIVERYGAPQEAARGVYDCRVVSTGPSGQLLLACLPE
nr:hypothetical protein [Pandoravirus massiliensis]